ncbi:proton-conducting transporter membrane subunit, partial [Elusimicrobiota bacterium]
YILMHGLAKGGLFLCAGIIEHHAKTKDITKMGGLIKYMPITAVSFLLCAFSVMGTPPLGGFFSKYMVITGAVANGQFYIAFTYIVGAFLTLIYLLRVFTLVFLGEAKSEATKEGSFTMVSSVTVLALLSVVGGVYISYISGPVQFAAQQMLGIIK